MAHGQPESLGEAILRELGVFGQSVGRQLQATQQFNVESEQQNLIDRLSFEAGEEQRQALLGLSRDRLTETRRRGDIAQQGFDLRRSAFELENVPGLDPADFGPQKPMSIKDIEDMLGRKAFEEGGEPGFFDFQARRTAARQKPTKATAPKGITPIQRDRATQEIFEQKRQEVLERAGALDLQNLQELSAEGLAQESGGFLGFGATPDPDSTAFNALREFRQIGAPEHAAAFERGDSLRAFRPALFPGQAQPQQLDPSPPGSLAAAQGRILKTIGGAVTPEQDQQGRVLYDDWDQLSPGEKAEIVKRGFPTE